MAALLADKNVLTHKTLTFHQSLLKSLVLLQLCKEIFLNDVVQRKRTGFVLLPQMRTCHCNLFGTEMQRAATAFSECAAA